MHCGEQGIIGDSYAAMVSGVELKEEETHFQDETYEMPHYFATEHKLNRFGVSTATMAGRNGASAKRRLVENHNVAFPLHFAVGQSFRATTFGSLPTIG
jgi:hypothetical protein